MGLLSLKLDQLNKLGLLEIFELAKPGALHLITLYLLSKAFGAALVLHVDILDFLLNIHH